MSMVLLWIQGRVGSMRPQTRPQYALIGVRCDDRTRQLVSKAHADDTAHAVEMSGERHTQNGTRQGQPHLQRLVFHMKLVP